MRRTIHFWQKGQGGEVAYQKPDDTRGWSQELAEAYQQTWGATPAFKATGSPSEADLWELQRLLGWDPRGYSPPYHVRRQEEPFPGVSWRCFASSD